MPEIKLTPNEFATLMQHAIEAGVAEYVKMHTPSKDLLSQRKAFKMFGEARVRRWIDKEMISAIRNGAANNSKKLYSFSELLRLDKIERSTPILIRK